MSTTTTVSTEVQLINQISLEQIVQVVYDEQVLDQNFTLITKILRELRNGLKESQIENQKQTKEIIIQKEKNNEQNELLANLKKELKNLQDDVGKSNSVSGDVWKEIKEIKENLSKCNQKADLGCEKGSKNEKDINWIIEELQQLQDRVKELQNQSDYLVKKTDYNDQVAEMERRVDAIEKQIQNVKIQDIEQNLKVLQQDAGDHANAEENKKKHQEMLEITKNNIDHILKEISNLKSQIKKLENAANEAAQNQRNKTNSSFTSNSNKTGTTIENPEESDWSSTGDRDQQLIQDLMKRLGLLEESLQNLKYSYEQLMLKLNAGSNTQNHFNKGGDNTGINTQDFEKLRSDMVKMKNEMKKLSESSEQTRDLVNVHDHDISELKRLLDHLNNQVLQIGAANGGGGNVNDENLNNRLTTLRNELLSRLKGLKKELNEKFVTTDQFNEELSKIYGLFADKDETQKALASLEKRLNQIQNLVMMMLNEAHGGEEDARGVKRPLQWTCLSCDKDIPGYQAKLGQFRPWNQLPARYHSPEKLGTFGKGHVKLESIHKSGNNTQRSPSLEQRDNSYDNALNN